MTHKDIDRMLDRMLEEVDAVDYDAELDAALDAALKEWDELTKATPHKKADGAAVSLWELARESNKAFRR